MKNREGFKRKVDWVALLVADPPCGNSKTRKDLPVLNPPLTSS